MKFKSVSKEIRKFLSGNLKKEIIVLILLLMSSILMIMEPIISKNLMDRGLLEKNFNLVLFYSVLLIGIVMVDQILGLIRENIRIDLKNSLTLTLYNKIIEFLCKIRIDELLRINTTNLYNNITTDIKSITMILEPQFFMIITKIFIMIGGIIGLFVINWKMMLIILFLIPVKIIWVRYIAIKRREIVKETMINQSKFSSWFADTVDGIKDIKIYGVFEERKKEFEQMFQELVSNEKNFNIQDIKNQIFDKILMESIICFIYIIGMKELLNMQMSIGEIFAFSTYTVLILSPIALVFNLKLTLISWELALKRYQEFFERRMEEIQISSKKLQKIEGKNIQFNVQDIQFSYEKKKVLNNIKLEGKIGEKISIVGSNGAGKSTLINLLLRFYMPDSGEIYLNGKNIQEINIQSYRNLFGIVSQDSFLFNDTIKNNIYFYNSEVNAEEFYSVLKDCGLIDFYQEVGEDYIVGKNGCLLSAGQRQKVILARALLYNRSVLILDEATANIDKKSKEDIKKVIKKLEKKLVFIVSHNDDILDMADKTLEL